MSSTLAGASREQERSWEMTLHTIAGKIAQIEARGRDVGGHGQRSSRGCLRLVARYDDEVILGRLIL